MTADNYTGVFDGRLPFGKRPALIVIDVVMAYLTPGSPLYDPAFAAALTVNERLVAAARQAGVPVLFTNVVYQPGGADGGLFYRKVPALAAFQRGSAHGMFPPSLQPGDGETIVSKQYASAFFGTALASTLTARGIDTVILTGFSTSGCVRATALDALQHGFAPFVVREACGDRHAAPHEANLFDLQAKYAEVIDEAAIVRDRFASAVSVNARGGVAVGPTMRAIFGDRPGIFLICLLTWSLTNMDQALFGFAVPGMIAEFGLSLQSVGLILTISFAAAAILVIPAGFAADRFGRGATLCMLLLLSAIMVGMQGLAGSVVALTLFRALGFGFSGGLSPVTNALVVEHSGVRYRGVAMGLLQCGYPIGWLLASLGAAPLLDQYGWRAACLLAFLVVPLVLPLAWVLRRYSIDRAPPAPVEASAGPIAPPAGFATLLLPEYRRTTLATAAIFFLFGGAYAGSAFFFPTFFTETRGYSPAEAASLIGLSNGIAIFGYLAAALVGEFLLTRRTVFVLWCLGGAVALAGLLWLSAGRTQDIIWYGLTAALFFGSQAVVIVFVAELFPARIRGRALATCASAPLSLGFALFPLVVPMAVGAAGWQMGLTIVVIPLLTAAGLIALLLPNRPSGMAIA